MSPIKSRHSIALAALLAAAAVPGLGRAQQDSRRLNSLEDRITALEDQLRESQAVIKAQQEQLKTVGPASVSQGGSSLDAFLQTVSIGGHLAASYAYNFNNPANNAGANTLCQFQCNHNEFSLDAAKLEIGRVASEPGKFGFAFDLLYGQNANILGSLASFVPSDKDSTPNGASSDQEFFLQQAYASYNLNGVEFKLGKFETLLGYEVLDTDGNVNVTHGLLFTFALPAFHTGVLASGSVGENFSWAAGAVNGFNNTRENGDGKGLLGRLQWKSGPLLFAANTYVGTLGETRVNRQGVTVGDNDPKTKILDGIVEWAYGESSKAWLNVDVGRTSRRFESTPVGPTSTARFFAADVGIKQQLTDKLYLGLRAELFKDPQGVRLGSLGSFNGPGNLSRLDVYTGTITLGYQIAPGLLARLEYRQDYVDCNDDDQCDFFFGGSGLKNKDRNHLGVVELVYSFD